MASPRIENGHEDVDTAQEYHPSNDAPFSSATTTTVLYDPNTGLPQQSTQQMTQYPLQQQPPPTQTQSEPMGSTTLAVTNLPYRIRWQDLKDLFRRYGTPSRADVFLAPDGRSRGVGMVSMRTRREAENCVNDLNGYEWFGRKIGVKIDETGGHHAVAAAAMAGATIWEGLGFSTTDYEVLPIFYPLSCCVVSLVSVFAGHDDVGSWGWDCGGGARVIRLLVSASLTIAGWTRVSISSRIIYVAGGLWWWL
jgi:hypothetical protein